MPSFIPFDAFATKIENLDQQKSSLQVDSYIFAFWSYSSKDKMVVLTINEPHLNLNVMQSHSLCRMHFGQYHAHLLLTPSYCQVVYWPCMHGWALEELCSYITSVLGKNNITDECSTTQYSLISMNGLGKRLTTQPHDTKHYWYVSITISMVIKQCMKIPFVTGQWALARYTLPGEMWIPSVQKWTSEPCHNTSPIPISLMHIIIVANIGWEFTYRHVMGQGI